MSVRNSSYSLTASILSIMVAPIVRFYILSSKKKFIWDLCIHYIHVYHTNINNQLIRLLQLIVYFDNIVFQSLGILMSNSKYIFGTHGNSKYSILPHLFHFYKIKCLGLAMSILITGHELNKYFIYLV